MLELKFLVKKPRPAFEWDLGFSRLFVWRYILLEYDAFQSDRLYTWH